jgi:hypothetical protein
VASQKYIICACLWVLFCSSVAMSQVPVKNEPRHHPVLQNKYIRLLDVWLPPADTTLYHIHETPSVFVILSNTVTGAQIKGESWVKAAPALGNVWYRSFSPDMLVHRVCNMDSVVFHVNDIEILSFFDSAGSLRNQPLAYPVVFNNERAAAYQVKSELPDTSVISKRGPIIIEPVSGEGIVFHNTTLKQAVQLKPGKYLYVEPGTSFYLTHTGAGNINLVIFEIK